MKKNLLIKLLIIISIIISHKLYAVDITVGATTWYAQSEQYYTQSKSAYFMHNALVKSNQAFLYGPTLSVRFSNDFNLTFVYLFGNFETLKDDGSFKYKSKYRRSDSDLALNYRLSDYFKVFLGLKYLSYDITPGDTDEATFLIRSKEPHSSLGSGLGVSATIPIVGDLFVLGTVSGLYLFGKDKVGVTNDDGVTNPRSVNLDYNEYGMNSTIALAYYIAHYSTVISLGGRFQYLIADYKNNAIYLDSIKFTIYGVTLTATYTFSI